MNGGKIHTNSFKREREFYRRNFQCCWPLMLDEYMTLWICEMCVCVNQKNASTWHILSIITHHYSRMLSAVEMESVWIVPWQYIKHDSLEWRANITNRKQWGVRVYLDECICIGDIKRWFDSHRATRWPPPVLIQSIVVLSLYVCVVLLLL